MNAAVLALIGLVIYALGYLFYSRFLAQKIFNTGDSISMPSHILRDDKDFLPTNKHVLLGHHYASIAGAAPILGPAIAVIWGWLPAFLWVTLGAVLIGATHDFGTLVVSARHQGRSIGSIAANYMSPMARTLFLSIIFLLVFMIIPVFARAIARLFVAYPGSVIPINFEIIVAVILGLYTRRTGVKLLLPSLIALVSLYLMIWVGWRYPVHISGFFPGLVEMFGPLGTVDAEVSAWLLLLMIYAFIASLLPVWILLQPRDFINSHQLFLALGILYLGIFISARTVVAPALASAPADKGSWFPLLFVTIACGAISGFHSLVSSGTTAKQLNQLKDARAIGYGGMLGEGVLALAATLAVTAGFVSRDAWLSHYHSWGVAAKHSIVAFVDGASTFLTPMGIPPDLAAIFLSVVVISFAATTLDTAFRLQCYILGEFGESVGWEKLQYNRTIQASIVLVASLYMALTNQVDVLWPLFGTTNQLVGGLALLVISLWVYRSGRNFWYTLIPMLFLAVVTTWSIILEMNAHRHNGNWSLFFLSLVILIFEILILREGWKAFQDGPSPEVVVG